MPHINTFALSKMTKRLDHSFDHVCIFLEMDSGGDRCLFIATDCTITRTQSAATASCNRAASADCSLWATSSLWLLLIDCCSVSACGLLVLWDFSRMWPCVISIFPFCKRRPGWSEAQSLAQPRQTLFNLHGSWVVILLLILWPPGSET